MLVAIFSYFLVMTCYNTEMLMTVDISYCDLLVRRKILNQNNQEIREPTQFPSPIEMKPTQKTSPPHIPHTRLSSLDTYRFGIC